MITAVLSLDDVAALAGELPETAEVDRRGQRTWQVGTRTFAWERPFTGADLRRFGDDPVPDGPILAVRTGDLEAKDALLASSPRTFFTIPHFDGFAAVLVHLRTAHRRHVRDALAGGWYACATPALRRAHFPDGRPD